ncbi:uncharacterized protein [Rutidosis leptorrhynchoides]|uniref:uncharacterized protein n=1 Tax=Rutidosis leptorrhynchoides TaxID=125765 RepID=UPI003A99C7A8
MFLKTPEDAMPWVGLYVVIASLVCIFAMVADAFHGFKQGKLWFPCKFFTLNAASLTIIAVAMKIPLGLTGDKELLVNMIALVILIITIIVNVCIQIATWLVSSVAYVANLIILTTPLIFTLFPFSVALTVPESRRIFELQYKELHGLSSNHKEIYFSYKELVLIVNKYWIMAEIGNPQFVIACSQVSSALGFICLPVALYSTMILFTINVDFSYLGHSDYKWSIKAIVSVQVIGVLVGSIAPMFRCFSVISYFNLSKK